MMALQCSDPSVALELIKRGANVNEITRESRRILKYGSSSTKGETVLDLVRGQKERLREYKPPITSPPELQYGMDEALSRVDEGTWKHATMKVAVNVAKRQNEWKLKHHDDEKRRHADLKGKQMKQAAIDSAVEAFELIEEQLLAKGGKTFQELYPEFKSLENVANVPRGPWVQPWRNLEFVAEFTFHLDPNLTEKRKAKYIEL